MKFIKNNYKTIIFIIVSIIAIIAVAGYSIINPMYKNQLKIVENPVESKDVSSSIASASKDTMDTENDIDNSNIVDESNIEITQDNIYKQEQKEDEIINVLLCGVDTRSYDLNSRSDTLILASYNKTQHSLKLVSFMRDSWVYLPERGWSRINTATVYGGTGLLINTINENFDLDIQNYVQIKFDDFRYIIDAIGGIDVELSRDEINYINRKLHSDDRDWSNDITAEPGVVHLNGAQALWHCRNRSIGNSDYTRTERQREVIGIIVDKVLKMNLGQATVLVFDLINHVNTNIPLGTIFDLGKDALLAGDISIESARVPFDGEFWSANKNGASVLELDIDGNTEKLHEFLGYNDSTTDQNKDITEQTENNTEKTENNTDKTENNTN